MIMIAALLICCSSPLITSLTPLACGENLTHPEPRDKSKIGGSWADLRLPFYTSGFD